MPRCVSGVAHVLQRRNERDIPQHPPVWKESAVLLHVSYLPSQKDGRLGANVFLADSHFAALRLDQAIETAEKRGFARSAFSDKSDGLARRYVDAHIVERNDAPEVMRDVSRSQGGRHAHKSDIGATQPL
jgi:hypothetical protein